MTTVTLEYVLAPHEWEPILYDPDREVMCARCGSEKDKHEEQLEGLRERAEAFLAEEADDDE